MNQEIYNKIIKEIKVLEQIVTKARLSQVAGESFLRYGIKFLFDRADKETVTIRMDSSEVPEPPPAEAISWYG